MRWFILSEVLGTYSLMYSGSTGSMNSVGWVVEVEV